MKIDGTKSSAQLVHDAVGFAHTAKITIQFSVIKSLVVREMSALETLKELVKLAFSILCSLTILAAGLALLERSVRFV
jgi:hypothetical protein